MEDTFEKRLAEGEISLFDLCTTVRVQEVINRARNKGAVKLIDGGVEVALIYPTPLTQDQAGEAVGSGRDMGAWNHHDDAPEAEG